MTLGILECGKTPSDLLPRFGTYADMVQTMLGARDTVTYDVTHGVLPATPTECDAYVLTGSSAGVYDDLPWIPGLLAFLRQARGRAALVGICFGHQAMATAFGGTVEKSAKGWGIGLHPYDVVAQPPWLSGTTPIHIPASHQDQVVTCPSDARVFASSAFAPFAGLDYGDAISVQFHPEFDATFGTALIETRRQKYGALADPAIASYARPDDCARVASWITRFLDMSTAARPLAPATNPGSSYAA